MNLDPALSTFVSESRELLREMEAELLACEHGEAGAESINAIFRAAHTIKGSSGLFGLNAIVEFTHVVEGVLDRVRARTLELDNELAALLIECRDHMQAMIDCVAQRGEVDSEQLDADGARLLQRLEAFGGSRRTATPAAPPTAAADSTKPQTQPQPDAWRALTDCWHISVRFGPDVLTNGMDPLSFLRYLTTFGEIAGLQVVDDGMPPFEQFDPEVCWLGYEIGLRTDAGKDRIEAAFEFVRDDCTLRILPPRSQVAEYVALIRDLPEADDRLGELLVRCGTLTRQELNDCLDMQAAQSETTGGAAMLGEVMVREHVVQPAVVEAALRRQREARTETKKADGLLRIDSEKLDRLIDLIGELVTAGAATSIAARVVGGSELNESTLRLSRLVEEVRDQALKLRMVQIGPTFARFKRVVRDVAREVGKQIRLEMSGGETELDKTLIESIVDPLTHLVRNAIDHGVEAPQERLARGKSAEGLLRLNARHDAGSIVIEVQDDGAGLNRERIVRRALERGLIEDASVLSDAQVHALIFEPGFSTAQQVTNLSGRGVGMDVVKRNVAAQRGTIEIESREGVGTLVRIRLPLTLAIIDGFLVRVGRSSFVLPLETVEECVELEAGQRAADDGHSYINLRGSVLPFIRLRELLGVDGARGKRESVVVVRWGGKRAGVVVDELLGELQTVIKPVSRLFSRLQGVSGSTILGSGEVALILDVGGLVERCLAGAEARPPQSRNEEPNAHLVVL
ncbi:MAG TPA: chemotaxis protein CheA [Steroidobacter sp.]|nr:chemotaxis protein CheA [Steroidobacter sp.]